MGRGDYILGTDHRDFYKICIRDPRVLMYHRIILVELKGDGENRNRNYCKGRTIWTIVDPRRYPRREEDVSFEDL